MTVMPTLVSVHSLLRKLLTVDLGNFEFSSSGSFVKIDDSNSRRDGYLVADTAGPGHT
jgi:hypothetical protein